MYAESGLVQGSLCMLAFDVSLSPCDNNMANLNKKLLILCRTRYTLTAFHFRGFTFDDSCCVQINQEISKFHQVKDSRNRHTSNHSSIWQWTGLTYVRIHMIPMTLKCAIFGKYTYNRIDFLDIWAPFLFEDFIKFHCVLLIIFSISAHSVWTPYK